MSKSNYKFRSRFKQGTSSHYINNSTGSFTCDDGDTFTVFSQSTPLSVAIKMKKISYIKQDDCLKQYCYNNGFKDVYNAMICYSNKFDFNILNTKNNYGFSLLESLLHKKNPLGQIYFDKLVSHVTNFTKILFSDYVCNDIDTIKKLISHPNCDINATNRIDYNIFTHIISLCESESIMDQYEEILILLIQYCSINQCIHSYPWSVNTSPLSIACYVGNVNIVKALLKMDSVELNSINDKGYSPLFFAFQRKHLDIVQLLLGDNRINVSLGVCSRGYLGTIYKVCDLLEIKEYNIVKKLMEHGYDDGSITTNKLLLGFLINDDELITRELTHYDTYDTYNTLIELWNVNNDLEELSMYAIKYNLPLNTMPYVYLSLYRINEFCNIIDTVDIMESLPGNCPHKSIYEMFIKTLSVMNVFDKHKLFLNDFAKIVAEKNYPLKIKFELFTKFMDNKVIDESEYKVLFCKSVNNIPKEELVEEFYKALHNDTDTDNIDNYCNICMASEAIYFNNTCGHMVICDQCKELNDTNMKTYKSYIHECPSCRTQIGKLTKLYK